MPALGGSPGFWTNTGRSSFLITVPLTRRRLPCSPPEYNPFGHESKERKRGREPFIESKDRKRLPAPFSFLTTTRPAATPASPAPDTSRPGAAAIIGQESASLLPSRSQGQGATKTLFR